MFEAFERLAVAYRLPHQKSTVEWGRQGLQEAQVEADCASCASLRICACKFAAECPAGSPEEIPELGSSPIVFRDSGIDGFEGNLVPLRGVPSRPGYSWSASRAHVLKGRALAPHRSRRRVAVRLRLVRGGVVAVRNNPAQRADLAWRLCDSTYALASSPPNATRRMTSLTRPERSCSSNTRS